LFTTLSLADIASALVRDRPHHPSLAPGWGGPWDGDGSNLGQWNAPPPVSDPVILPASGHYPERLHARYYYFESPKWLREMYPNGSERETHTLQAIDVLISRVAGSRSEHLCLFSAHDSAKVAAGAYSSMQTLVVAADSHATTQINSSPIDFADPDVFLWLLTQLRDRPNLTGDTSLVRIDSISGQDSGSRLTQLTKGVSFDRPAFLTAIADVDRLGPGRLKIVDKNLKARWVFDLWVDGSFKLVSGLVRYRSGPTEDQKRWMAVQDLAYRIIPLIKAAYVGDREWDSNGRTAEVDRAIAALLERYGDRFPRASQAQDSPS
jgi:hypothetical protein